MSRLNQPALLFYRAISLLRHKSQVWFIGGVEHTSNEKMRGRCWLYKGHNTRHRQEQHMRKHSKPPAHEKWIKLSAVRGGDVHLKTATESSVNPPAHWASSRNRNIMMLAVVLGCNNQSLQGFSRRMLQPKMPEFMVWGVLLQRDCRKAADTHAWKQCGK